MNFFSHAIVAARRSEDPRWILGSMLPDFVGMAGMRLRKVAGNPTLERGVDFHHVCDDAFHGAPLFVKMQEDVREELERGGLDSGPAMAIGHVGVELLLDGYLVEQHGVIPGYRAAIEEAARVDTHLDFHSPEPDAARSRWQRLAQRMVEAPVPERYTEPSFVADRLIFILSTRPRLAVPFGREGMVYDWAHRAAPEVAAQAVAVFAQVEDRLARAGAQPPSQA